MGLQIVHKEINLAEPEFIPNGMSTIYNPIYNSFRVYRQYLHRALLMYIRDNKEKNDRHFTGKQNDLNQIDV